MVQITRPTEKSIVRIPGVQIKFHEFFMNFPDWGNFLTFLDFRGL